MSDQPLFTSTDEQERAYAPQQQPEGSPAEQAAAADDHARQGDTSDAQPGVPAAGAGLLSQASGGIGGATNVANPAGPAVVGSTPDDQTAGPAPADE